MSAAGESVPAKLSGDLTGEQIGRYRLLRCLGTGGMAEVFLAERVDDELVHRVALKKIRPGLGSGAILERFLRERRILARLEHPGIARLLDGGSTPRGEPYFVLELVEGKPITEHCAERALALAERLRLMIEVCEAVQAAHQRLVIHRDLKPSNILVTPEGRVKLLDFGIAKLLEPTLPEERTLADGRSLTPLYAAPEQLLGQPVTTASDVFALGILLFEVLAETHPFPHRGRSPAGASAAEREQALRRPSEVAPAHLARQLEGDLDTIVGKALESEPARRYVSAAALAEDLERFLARRPIGARRAGWTYRARRFIERNRWGSLGLAAAVVSLALGLGVALRESAVARHEARRAERVRGYLESIFRQADPSGRRGATITAREVMEEGARRASSAFEGDADVHAEVLDSIARVQRNLGLTAEARGTAQEALALRQATHGPSERAVIASQITLAEVALAQGDLDAALAAAESARGEIVLGEGELGQRLLLVLIYLRAEADEGAGALALVQEYVDRAVAAGRGGSSDVAMWRLRQAGLLAGASRVAEAVPMARDALAVLEREPALGRLGLAKARILAADLFETAGLNEEAEALMHGAVDVERQVLGERHPDVALHEIKLGFTQIERRKFVAAEATLLHAVSVLRELDHFELGSALRYLGFAVQGQGRIAEAAELYAEAEAVYRASFGDGHTYVQSARLSRGWALMNLDRLAEAEAVLRPVIAVFEHPETGNANSLRAALKYLGEVRRRRGAVSEALALHRRAKAIELEIFGSHQHPGVVASNLQLVRDLLASPSREALAEARTLADEGLAILKVIDADSPRVDDLLVESARIALAQRDPARAAAELRQALPRLVQRLGEDHPETRAARELLARAGDRGAGPS